MIKQYTSSYWHKFFYRLLLLIVVLAFAPTTSFAADDCDALPGSIISPGTSLTDYLEYVRTNREFNLGYAPSVVDDFRNNIAYRCPVNKSQASKVSFTYGSNTLTINKGTCQKAGGHEFCAVQKGSVLCLYAGDQIPKLKIACHTYNDYKELQAPSCIPVIAESCFKTVANHTKATIPMSSFVVQCVEDSLRGFFVVEPTTATCKDSDPEFQRHDIFLRIQNYLRVAVTMALTLYIIFWGFNIVLSQEVPDKGDIFKHILLFALVSYFAIGNGWHDYYPALVGISKSFGIMIVNALTKTSGHCHFEPSTYDPNYWHLAIWDTIDCKIGFYLGYQDPSPWPAIIGTSVPLFFVSLSLFFAPVPAVGASLFAIVLLMILFIFTMIGLLIYVVQLYIIAAFALTLILFLSPIFVPMVLFNYSKGWFNKWFNELISYSLYPIIITAFSILFIGVFDRIILGDPTEFSWSSVSGYTCDINVNKSLLCALNQFAYTTLDMVFWHPAIPTLSSGNASVVMEALLNSTLQGILFAFLFVTFAQILPSIAAELTGTHLTNIGSMISSNPLERGASAMNKLRSGGAVGKHYAKSIKKKMSRKSTPQPSPNNTGNGGSGGNSNNPPPLSSGNPPPLTGGGGGNPPPLSGG